MTKENFFNKFWLPYLEYEAITGFSRKQMEQEILDLGIEKGDRVINVGINWGESLQMILENNSEISALSAVDSSRRMIKLAQDIFSKRGRITDLRQNLSPEAYSFLEKLHARAGKNSGRVNFVYSSAEDLYSREIVADKIAATMGFHWLTDPEKAFHSFNRSLNLEGKVTFSTASSRFEISSPEKSFTQNPYYTTFFDNFNELVQVKIGIDKIPKKTVIKKDSLQEIHEVIERNGFMLDNHREYAFEVSPEVIDEVCKAGIKFSYSLDAKDPLVKGIVEEALSRTKSHYSYSDHPARYEICPIFTLMKIK